MKFGPIAQIKTFPAAILSATEDREAYYCRLAVCYFFRNLISRALHRLGLFFFNLIKSIGEKSHCSLLNQDA